MLSFFPKTKVEIILYKVHVIFTILIKHFFFLESFIARLFESFPDIASILVGDTRGYWVVLNVHNPRQEHVHLFQLLVNDKTLIVLRDAAKDVTLIYTGLLDAFDCSLIAREAHMSIKAYHSCNIVNVRPCLLTFCIITF